jgi:hypothetical protein
MKSLQIGRGRVDIRCARPLIKRLSAAPKDIPSSHGNHRQMRMEVDRLLVLQGNLLTFTPSVGLLRLFCLATTVPTTAAFHSRPHKELFARDASTPKECREQKQREKRTG